MALAAIKALHAENAALRAQVERDAAWRARADARLAALERKMAGAGGAAGRR